RVARVSAVWRCGFFVRWSGGRRALRAFPTRTLFRSAVVGVSPADFVGRDSRTMAHYLVAVSGFGGHYYRRRWCRSIFLASRYRRSEEHTSELQSRFDLVCRLLLEKKNAARGAGGVGA